MPKWFVIEEEAEKKLEAGSSGAGARLSRSLTVGSKYAKVKRAAPCNGHVDGESSEECTDDEIYLTRHKPFEEQEVRFRCFLFSSLRSRSLSLIRSRSLSSTLALPLSVACNSILLSRTACHELVKYAFTSHFTHILLPPCFVCLCLLSCTLDSGLLRLGMRRFSVMFATG